MLQKLTHRLAEIKAQGSFATRRTSAADDLRLDVKGVGRIGLPIARATAMKLRGVGQPARYGFKDQTRLDARVRDIRLHRQRGEHRRPLVPPRRRRHVAT